MTKKHPNLAGQLSVQLEKLSSRFASLVNVLQVRAHQPENVIAPRLIELGHDATNVAPCGLRPAAKEQLGQPVATDGTWRCLVNLQRACF